MSLDSLLLIFSIWSPAVQHFSIQIYLIETKFWSISGEGLMRYSAADHQGAMERMCVDTVYAFNYKAKE